MKPNRRWLKSVLAASLDVDVIMPWVRGQRRKPILLPAQAQAPAPAKRRKKSLQ